MGLGALRLDQREHALAAARPAAVPGADQGIGELGEGEREVGVGVGQLAVEPGAAGRATLGRPAPLFRRLVSQRGQKSSPLFSVRGSSRRVEMMSSSASSPASLWTE